MDTDSLAEFYQRIGAALWHLQYLEDVLASFLTLKLLNERRRAGQKITPEDAYSLLADKRKLTLGPLLESCRSKKIISAERQPRFEAFKLERHWLVHRSLVENGDDLYKEATRNAVLNRIGLIQEEAIALKNLVGKELETWGAGHGINPEAIDVEARSAIEKLKSG